METALQQVTIPQSPLLLSTISILQSNGNYSIKIGKDQRSLSPKGCHDFYQETRVKAAIKPHS